MRQKFPPVFRVAAAVTVTPTVSCGQSTMVLPLCTAAAYFQLKLP